MPGGDDVIDLSREGMRRIGLDDAHIEVLQSIRQEIGDEYRERFAEQTDLLRRQTAAIERLQNTVDVLVEHLMPDRKGQVPTAFKVAGPSEDVDLATVTADPIAAGFTLSQADLARALGITQADVSILVRAFKLPDDPACAMTVRRGKSDLVNYHRDAIDRFAALVRDPPLSLKADAKKALERVRRRLG
jgi:hypothetical protein